MTSFDFLGPGRTWQHGLLRFLSRRLADGTLAFYVTCAVIPAAAWGLEAQQLQRALHGEAMLSRTLDRRRVASAQTARRYHRAQALGLLVRSLDAQERSGAEEARRLTYVADALPTDAWLTALSESNAAYTLDGGVSTFAELGRAIGALGALPGVREAVLVEAAQAAREGSPEALRYRMRVVWNSP